ncbi:MAG: chain-length determining protein [Comamonadaceae bacterium]|nr:MAG: chain-length determining protein [Comamonadaceae bacterium]
MTDIKDKVADPKEKSRFPRVVGWLRHEMAPAIFRRRIIGAALICSLLAAIYWMLVASDRYVSEAHVIVQRTDLAGGQGMDFQSLLTGGSGNRPDQLLLRDHLRSVDMLRKIDAKLDLRKHYSDSEHDILSRMWDDETSIERFHAHFLSRTEIEFDDYGGVIVIKAQAYDPKTAHAIATMLVQEGERFMNQMAHDLAQAQVGFLEGQVSTMNQRAIMARRAVLDYQDRKGLASPQASAESIAAIVARLESQRTDLQTQRSSLLTYLVPDHPNVVMLNQQLAAVERQIGQEQARLAAPSGGRTLNRTVEEFQRLEMDAAFAQDVYKTSLVALERGRVEATRTIKKVSQLQAPSMPEHPMEPRRLYNTVVFLLLAMLLATIAQMLVTIVRDHQD